MSKVVHGEITDRCCAHCKNAADDHDILIEIRTNLKNFIGVSVDHEKRIRRTEQWGFVAIGALFMIELAISAFIAIHFSGSKP